VVSYQGFTRYHHVFLTQEKNVGKCQKGKGRGEEMKKGREEACNRTRKLRLSDIYINKGLRMRVCAAKRKGKGRYMEGRKERKGEASTKGGREV